MTVKSKAQGKLMRAVAHNPEFAKKVGIKQAVGREFTEKTSLSELARLPQRKTKKL